MFKKQVLLVLGVFIFSCVFSGCTYLTNRKNDAKDMFDLGITTSSKPGFAAYIDFFGLFPVGVTHVDGKLIGLGKNSWGTHDFREHGTGYFLGGKLQHGLDDFDAQNPDDPKRYDTGLIGYFNGTTFCQTNPNVGQGTHPKIRQTAPKTLHLGWVGIEWGCRFMDLFDFFLGWTTLDIAHDDMNHASQPSETNEPAAEIPAGP